MEKWRKKYQSPFISEELPSNVQQKSDFSPSKNYWVRFAIWKTEHTAKYVTKHVAYVTIHTFGGIFMHLFRLQPRLLLLKRRVNTQRGGGGGRKSQDADARGGRKRRGRGHKSLPLLFQHI